MFENRIRDYFPPSTDPVLAAFVPCPLYGAHPSMVAEVYRLARELTDAQMRRPEVRRIPAFSTN